jgi:hypothetical protein
VLINFQRGEKVVLFSQIDGNLVKPWMGILVYTMLFIGVHSLRSFKMPQKHALA